MSDNASRTPITIVDYVELANTVDKKNEWTNQRLKILMGSLLSGGKSCDGKRSNYNMEKWKFMLNAPFEIGDGCCNVMKKSLSHDYTKRTGMKPIIATMASESKLRTQKWIQQGCNTYEGIKASSKPMSFWTEQDVYAYIYCYGIEIAPVYGDVIINDRGIFTKDQIIHMMLFEGDRPTFDTTGCKRTGCMFCMYGVHLEKSPNRLERMKITHPKQYNYIMKPESEGGLGYKDKIDWLNENGNLNIKY